MASKSKRRGRVFRASCILAALIIAGSSFAWFTSKDEVTNRLTANSDYGVSIVESFVPPANWLPGETVNKDVYAVNTGSVAAFVKETITGELNYTYEIPVTDFVTTCVELTPQQANAIDGATTEEAGGFLAWTNAQVVVGHDDETDTDIYDTYPTGSVNSARYEDANDDENDPGVANPRWTPPASGDYIFRRSIRNSATEGNTPVVTYTYAGYHYDAGTGKYYKIIIGEDAFRAAEETPGSPNSIEFDVLVEQNKITGTNIEIGEDGVITGTPDIKYVALREVKSAKPTLVYNPGDADNNAYILATYSDSNPDPASLTDAQAALLAAQQAVADAEAALAAAQNGVAADAATKDKNVADAEVDYQNAVYEHNTKKSRLDQAQADYNYAKALYEATKALNEAADARKEYQDLTDAAEEEMDDARGEVTGKAGDILNDTDYADILALISDDSDISYKKLIQDTNIETAINGNTDLTEAQGVLTRLSSDWTDIKTAAAAIKTNLEKIRDLEDTEDSDEADGYLQTVESNLADLKTALENYMNRYVALTYKATPTEAELTYLSLVGNDDADDIEAILDTVNGDFSDDIDDLRDLVDDYIEKERVYDAYHDGGNVVEGDDTTAVDGIAAEDTKWRAAVDTYNNAVGTDTIDGVDGARKTYNNATVDATTYQPERNAFELLQGTAPNRKLKDHGATPDGAAYTGLAADYSVGTNKAAGNPVITVTSGDPTSYPDYGNYLSTSANAANNPGEEAAYTAPELTKAIGTTTTEGTLKYEEAQAQNTEDEKEEYYDTQVDYRDNADATIQALQDALDAANDALADAEGDVEDAMISTSDIVIKINLAENDANLGWKYNAAETAEDPTLAAFYLKRVLEGGDTSEKLIDSVYLDSATTTADYKNLTFDLNVGLDSVQVTYDADQRYYTADAVNAADETFKLDVISPTVIPDDATALTWGTT